MDRQQRLICGYDVFAVFDGSQDQIFGYLGAADEFHDDIDIRAAYQCKRIVRRFGLAADHFSCLGQVLVGNGLDQDPPAGTTTDFLLVAA